MVCLDTEELPHHVLLQLGLGDPLQTSLTEDAFLRGCSGVAAFARLDLGLDDESVTPGGVDDEVRLGAEAPFETACRQEVGVGADGGVESRHDPVCGLFRNWSAAEGVTGLGAGVVSLR